MARRNLPSSRLALELTSRVAFLAARATCSATRATGCLPPQLGLRALQILMRAQCACIALACITAPSLTPDTLSILRDIAVSPHASRRTRDACRHRLAVLR